MLGRCSDWLASDILRPSLADSSHFRAGAATRLHTYNQETSIEMVDYALTRPYAKPDHVHHVHHVRLSKTILLQF